MTVQIKEICNALWEEEKKNLKHPRSLPEGANIFLALELIPARTKGEISYLTLERDPLEEFIAIYYTIRIKDYQNGHELPIMPKRIKTHPLEGRSAKKIMAEYAKLVKFYRGE